MVAPTPTSITLRPIEPNDNPGVAKVIRTVMPEFGADGPGFAIHDPEVNSMYESYRGAGHRFYVLVAGDRVVGCGGYAPLAGGEAGVCELKKMYFLPECRGQGLGRRLIEHLIEEARTAGYQRMYLETLKSMTAAKALYEKIGFRPLCAPLGKTGHFGCDTWYARDL